jgi:phage tail-like protein
MRGTVPGLPSPYPLITLLPAVYQEEDPFVGRFTAGLDDVLAPVIATLDNLDAYVDPMLAPPDFLEWLAGWVGVTVNDNAPVALHRATVARAAELHRMRGTVAGLRTALELLTGGRSRSPRAVGSRTPTAPARPRPATRCPGCGCASKYRPAPAGHPRLYGPPSRPPWWPPSPPMFNTSWR